MCMRACVVIVFLILFSLLSECYEWCLFYNLVLNQLYGASNLETLTANAADGTAVLSGVPNVHIKNKKTVSLRAVIDMPVSHRRSLGNFCFILYKHGGTGCAGCS